MKRLIFLLILLLIVSLVGLTAGLHWAPDALRPLWTGLRLPAATFDWLAELVDGDIGIVLTSPWQTASSSNVITASGTIEAEEVVIAAEIGGQVVEVLADEGDRVEAGQPLVRLDDSVIQAQLRQAELAVETARANLKAVLAGPRPAKIAAAQAALRQAQATQEGARQALKDAQRALENPQELDAQIHAAEARVALAGRQIEQARAQKAAITALREGIAGDNSDQGKTQRAVYQKQEEAGDEKIAAAQVEAQGAQRVLDFLRQMRENPLTLQVAVRAAEGQLRVAEEGVKVAEAALALAQAGPRPEEVALAKAQLAKAEASYELLRRRAARYTVSSPLDGVITTRAVNPGETAAPAAPLLVVSDQSRVTLKVYVPEPSLGYVHIGQRARVRVDAYPGRVFFGQVTYIAPEAEFTPKNVQTVEERVETVFAVKITLDNPDGALKPGMPADAELVIGR